MKTFLTVFFAVLCALAVAYFGVRLFERSEAWEGQKAEAIGVLQTTQRELAESREEMKLYLDPSRKAEADGLKDRIAIQAGRVASDESTLLDFYAHKPLPLSDEEKRQAAEWRRDVGTPR